MSAPSLLRFGSFELDVRSRELHHGSSRVRLQEQPFAILAFLLERPGQVVTRAELRDRLWPQGTFVDFEHSINAAIKRLRAALEDDANCPRFVETLPKRGYRFIGPVGAGGSQTATAAGTKSAIRLAVLPFSNLGGEDGQEYFIDGLTEEMIAQLGALGRGRLSVVARRSSMSFKGTTERARVVGETLHADYLLEGSVRREGDRVRIVAQLVEAATETQLWVNQYERHLSDWLSVQSDVAARISTSLATELAPATAGPRPPSTSVAAFQAYLKGRFHWNQLDDDRRIGSSSDVEQALACFAEALEIDARFAPAHAVLARVQVARAQQYLTAPGGALESAHRSAVRAHELDPGLAEAHLALGDTRRMLHWDWRGAEEAYSAAVTLNPSQESVHRRYALMLAIRARRPEAIREAELACDLAPHDPVVNVVAALVHYLTGHYDTAIERCQRLVSLGPGYLPARRLLGAAYQQTGQLRLAVDELEAVLTSGEPAPVATAWLAHATAIAGGRRAATRCLEQLLALRGSRYVSPYHLSLAYVGLGHVDSAFAALDQAFVEHDPALAYAAVEPRLNPLHDDPRYGDLLRRIGL